MKESQPTNYKLHMMSNIPTSPNEQERTDQSSVIGENNLQRETAARV